MNFCAQVLAFIGCGILVGCGLFSDEARDDRILLSGTIEAREVELAFLVGGRIARLYTDEGHALKLGQPAADLDSHDYDLALQRANADVAVAEAALANLRAGSRPQELRRAQARLDQARSELDYARTERDRIRTLADRQLAAREQLDQAQLRYETAQAEATQSQQNLRLVREGPRAEEIRQAEAELEARQTAARQARTELAYTRLVSPVAGVVSERLAEVGEVIPAGQAVLRVSELSQPWVRAYLNETDLARVRLGQAADVTVDGLTGHVFRGRLAFISPNAEFTPKTVETRELRVDLVYRVKIQVENPQGTLKIGMPADVVLATARTTE